jgi:hypothetical protein
MRRLGSFILGLVLSVVALAQSGTGVERQSVEGPGVECGHVYGPPCTSGSVSAFAITTEASSPLTTEASSTLVTEAAP